MIYATIYFLDSIHDNVLSKRQAIEAKSKEFQWHKECYKWC